MRKKESNRQLIHSCIQKGRPTRKTSKVWGIAENIKRQNIINLVMNYNSAKLNRLKALLSFSYQFKGNINLDFDNMFSKIF